MKSKLQEKIYVAFLRGINVGGHHKVPMAELKKDLEIIGLKNVKTFLNSGNIIFTAESSTLKQLEEIISQQLEEKYDFPIPVVITTAEVLQEILKSSPYKDVQITAEIRLYITFLKETTSSLPDLPWSSPDKSFSIVGRKDQAVFSVVDLSATKTTDAMKILENFFGKDITTRNWNTIERILNKI